VAGRQEDGTEGLIVVPARRGRAFRLAAGQRIKIVNTHGTQVVDTWALALPALVEAMSMHHTRAQLSSLRPARGDPLYSSLRRPIMTLVEDTSPGVHDTLMAACDARRYELLGHEGHHDSCTDNFHAALQQLGFEPRAVPAPLNLFMNIPWAEDGRLEFRPPRSEPGDFVVLRAEFDLVAVVSACPQDMVPINGPEMRPTDFQVEILS
jgi:uncharacterized protein